MGVRANGSRRRYRTVVYGAMMPPMKAVLYRMGMPTHVCPYGVEAKALLEQAGYEIDDHHLRSREETDLFKAQHGVPTTPLIYIDDELIGGCDDLKRHLESQ
jgi:glutaredoxin